jgi:hypothetical protein
MALNPLRERKQRLDQVRREELGAGRVEWRGKVQHVFKRDQVNDTDQVNQADKI